MIIDWQRLTECAKGGESHSYGWPTMLPTVPATKFGAVPDFVLDLHPVIA